MRVLIINVVCGIKSTGRICTDLAEELERQGNIVKIAYGRDNVPEQYKKYAVRIGNDISVNIHGIKARLFDASGFGSRWSTYQFLKWVDEFDPDVVHLHNIHGYFINIELLFEYLKTKRKRVIWTLHDCWAFSGHSALCDAAKCQRWVTGCFSCPQKKEYPKTYLDRSKYNWKEKKRIMGQMPNMTIVTPSNWLANAVKKSYLQEYTVKVIHNGIDLSLFKNISSNFRRQHNLSNKNILLGVASTWNELKGYYDFIKLAKLLDDSYRIILVGVSEKQKRDLPSNIIGIKRTESIQELVQIYSASDIFLNLTYCDTYPTVNIEAISCSIPVITYETGGSPESVRQGLGKVVEQGNIKELIEAIKAVKVEISEGKYKMLSTHRYDEFDNEQAIQKYMTLYYK